MPSSPARDLEERELAWRARGAMHAASERPVLLMLGDHDAHGTTWVRWWLGESDAEPRTWTVEEKSGRDSLAESLDRLHSSLPIRQPAETIEESVARALRGTLTNPYGEQMLMSNLGRLLFPGWLAGELRARVAAHGPAVIRITPPFNTARVPWETLIVPGGYGRRDGWRLLHFGSVVVEAPAAFHVGRAVVPASADTASGSIVTLIDPLIPDENSRLFADDQLAALVGPSQSFPPGTAVDAHRLGEALRAQPSPRGLLFVGHVESTGGNAGATSLRLSGAPTSVAGELPSSAAMGFLSARDLVLGRPAAGERLGRLGSELWPMPPHVAFIACDSGGDHGREEPFGLLIAALNNGAEYALGTRWVLLADRAFRDEIALAAGDPQPLVELARAAANVVASTDPVDTLRRFQLRALERWEESRHHPRGRSLAAVSPLMWGSLTMAVGSRRNVTSLADQANGTT